MTHFLPYNPGIIPSRPSPHKGEILQITVSGLPPYKDRHFSLRNSRHKIHERFKELRYKAIKAMTGRAPYRGPVKLEVFMYAFNFEKGKALVDYVGGVMDTLDGSHGTEFTYLPIVYEDDCQIYSSSSQVIQSSDEHYEIKITFM